MPNSTYRPDLMGSATLEPQGVFEAGSMQAFTLTYTAGAFGIDDTGSIKIGFRFATDFGPVQFTDPKAQGYTTAEASNGAILELKWEFKRNIRPWSRSLYIGVAKHFLRPGDTIIIRFGDRRWGSPGIRVQTYAEARFQFHVLIDAIGTYDYVALPESPFIAVGSGPGIKWQAILPTSVRAGAPFRLGLKIDDKWGNPSDKLTGLVRLVPSRPVEGLPRSVILERGLFGATIENLSAPPGELTIDVTAPDGRHLCRSNPLRIEAGDAELIQYWGDTHGQSDETLGTNSARDYFLFGRDRAFLDVMSHQGNDFQITGAFWRHLNDLTRSMDEPGRFVCLPGYEWSANTAVGGDRNVYFRHEGETLHRSSHAQIFDAGDADDEATDAHDAKALFAALADRDCIVMAHVGGRYADIAYAHDGRLETAVEVHSAWGTFEWIVWDAFEAGHRVGIVANSDGHKGRPGACYPGASFFGSYGGLTCFLSPSLDRDAIFECLRRRRHYATTGNRMYVNVKVHAPQGARRYLRDPSLFPAAPQEPCDHLIMGDIASVDGDRVQLEIDVVGSAPIERIDVFDGQDILETWRPFADCANAHRLRLVYEGAEYRGRARTTTWDGTLAVSDNAIVAAAVFNSWNLDRGIQHQDSTSVTWKAVTTGNFGGIDLWLKDPGAGQIRFETQHCHGVRDIASVCGREHIFSAGGLERAVKLYRLPDEMTQTAVVLHRAIRLREIGDTRLLVRITQEDGHRAWTSPIYLFRATG